MPNRSPESFQKITDVLCRSLKVAFDEVCPERYGGPLTLQRTASSSEEPAVSFRLEGPASIALRIHVQIAYVGGNVYDIVTQVEDGSPRCFTFSEPDQTGSSLSIAPFLGKKIARHLLDEVERRLGQQLLRKQVVAEG